MLLGVRSACAARAHSAFGCVRGPHPMFAQLSAPDCIGSRTLDSFSNHLSRHCCICICISTMHLPPRFAHAVLAYLLMPIPLVVIARARGDGFLESGSKHVLRWGEFFAAFIFSLIVGVPCILLRADVVEFGAVLMDLSGLVLAVAAGSFAAFISHNPDD